MRLVLENDTQVRPVGLDSRDRNCECWATLILLSFFLFLSRSFCHQLQSKSIHEELCPAVLGDP